MHLAKHVCVALANEGFRVSRVNVSNGSKFSKDVSAQVAMSISFS